MKNFLGVNTANEYGETSGAAAIAGVWAIGTLDSGALACFEKGGDNDGKLVSGSAPAPTGEAVYFAVNRATGGPVYTPPIYRSTLSYSKQSNVAAVAKVMFIGAYTDAAGNLDAVTGAVGVWSLHVIDKEKNVEDRSREFELSGPITAADTDQTIVDLIIAAWNADARAAAIATAAQGGDASSHYGVKLTAATAGKDFTVRVGPDSVLKNSPIYEYGFLNGAYTGTAYTNTVKNVAAIGLGSLVRDYEKEGEARRGVSQEGRALELFDGPTSMLTAGSSYVTYTLRWRDTQDNQMIDTEGRMEQEVVIAIVSTNTGCITAMDNILAAL